MYSMCFSSKEFEKGVRNLTEILKSENFQALYSNVAMVNVWNEKQRAGERIYPTWVEFITTLCRGLSVRRYLVEKYIR